MNGLFEWVKNNPEIAITIVILALAIGIIIRWARAKAQGGIVSVGKTIMAGLWTGALMLIIPIFLAMVISVLAMLRTWVPKTLCGARAIIFDGATFWEALTLRECEIGGSIDLDGNTAASPQQNAPSNSNGNNGGNGKQQSSSTTPSATATAIPTDGTYYTVTEDATVRWPGADGICQDDDEKNEDYAIGVGSEVLIVSTWHGDFVYNGTDERGLTSLGECVHMGVLTPSSP